MGDIMKVYDRKLDELSYIKAAQTVHSWSGAIEGYEQGFTIMLEHPDLEKAEIGFINSILSDWENYLDKTVEFILENLTCQPEPFRIGKEKAKSYLTKNDVPVVLPRFCFYETYDWMIHFAESSLPIADPYGFGVDFYHDQPIAIENFSEAEMIED